MEVGILACTEPAAYLYACSNCRHILKHVLAVAHFPISVFAPVKSNINSIDFDALMQDFGCLDVPPCFSIFQCSQLIFHNLHASCGPNTQMSNLQHRA
jgi:hypothetical protein